MSTAHFRIQPIRRSFAILEKHDVDLFIRIGPVFDPRIRADLHDLRHNHDSPQDRPEWHFTHGANVQLVRVGAYCARSLGLFSDESLSSAFFGGSFRVLRIDSVDGLLRVERIALDAVEVLLNQVRLE
jgi:hypothetical protein